MTRAVTRLVCASCDPTGARPNGIHEGNGFEEQICRLREDLERTVAGREHPGMDVGRLSCLRSISRAIYRTAVGCSSTAAMRLCRATWMARRMFTSMSRRAVGSCRSGQQSAGDVYDEAIGGCVALISAGTSAEESAFLDASETGSDVFFLTSSRLSSRDVDTSYDIYDAHECSASSPCAPAPAQPAPPCDTGDSCKPAPSPQPAIFGAPSSATFTGSGDLSPSPVPKVIPRGLTRAQKLARALKRCQVQAEAKAAGLQGAGETEVRSHALEGQAVASRTTPRKDAAVRCDEERRGTMSKSLVEAHHACCGSDCRMFPCVCAAWSAGSASAKSPVRNAVAGGG